MIEVHGWITIRETYEVEDETEEWFNDPDYKFYPGLSSIEALLDESPDFNLICKMVFQNGSRYVIISGDFNHKDGRWDYLMRLVKLISSVAIGSYGSIHFHDDEDKNGNENQFQVLVLRKGEIKFDIDQNLSPYFSAIENLRTYH